MATQAATGGMGTQELLAALAGNQEIVVLPLKRYTALLGEIEEVRERLQDAKDIRIIEEIENDPNQHWRAYADVEAELIAEGLLDAVRLDDGRQRDQAVAQAATGCPARCVHGDQIPG